MIKGVFGLGETQVKAIMIPRTDVVAISIEDTFEDIVKIVMKSGHSRIPVYEERIDNVIGFLHAKDLLPNLAKATNNIDIRKLLRPVMFVPEGKMIDDLLKEFLQKKMHIAVVVDEYGGMAGIVSLENILEEIVGEIQDEYDHEEEEIIKVAPNVYICDSRTTISDLNETLRIDLSSEGIDTIGGYVFTLFGKIPKVNERITQNGIEFKVENMEGRRIKKIKVTLKVGEQIDKENKA
ncbi:MAG: HlyC/CorC family transporter [Spirochaetota bacterium]|nr:MAG: HlyC/CorC family transporter [Spirochaetota bacterium]